jgi:hypothetical protein
MVAQAPEERRQGMLGNFPSRGSSAFPASPERLSVR